MKRFNYYLGLMFMLVFMTACHEEFDQPPVYIPIADAVPNMTIAEFKAKHWQESANYVDTVTEDEVIHGWVTANDVSNNIVKTIYISDGTSSLSISVNQNELYKKYRIGQEIVLPMKGHYVGKATGQMYVAAPYNYVNYNTGAVTLECLNMSSDELESLVQFNKLPDPSKVDTIDVKISDFQDKFDAETLLKYQGMLVRFRDVEITEADGATTYADPGSSAINRTIKDVDGKELIMRNSRSADFATEALPLGRHDIVGILGFYQTGSPMWQFYVRTIEDVIGEGKKGTKTLPYSVSEAIEAGNISMKSWIEGYIVGAVGPAATTVTSNSDIEWQMPSTLDNTIVIADSPDCKDFSKCIVVPLPQGSIFRTEANLRDNTNTYQAPIKVMGIVAPYMGMTGIVENTGTREEYVLDVAFVKLSEDFASGVPGNWTNLKVSGSKVWEKATFNSEVYVNVTGYRGSNPPYDIWLITPKLDIKNAPSKVFNFDSQVNNYGNIVLQVYLMNTNDPRTATVKVKLNPTLPKKPSSNYSGWVNSGDIDLSEWADGEYYIGFNYYAPNDPDNQYTTWCLDNVTFGMGNPDNRADFETMGTPKGQIDTYTSDKGWVASNSYLFAGGASNNNPYFQFIGLISEDGNKYATSPTINGKVGAAGTITSPVISGGMKKLTFSYGAPFSDKLLSFRVDVKQNGNVVQSWTESQDNAVRYQVYTFSKTCNVSGDFTIEITNLCPSNTSTNKDRVSIWNLIWDK